MPRFSTRSCVAVAVCCGMAGPALLPAQTGSPAEVLPAWISLVAAPGREAAATTAISHAGGGWERGALGSLVRRAGAGKPRRIIACEIDRAAYAVSEITSDGYLRVHNAEPGARHPLWEQFHEGQRVSVQRTGGDRVPGVFAVRSAHLWRRRAQLDAVGTTDDLWLDVGASSSADVARLGIRLLDPVVRELPPWSYGSATDRYVAGPGAVSRAGCAAVEALSSRRPRTGENIYVIATQGSFGHAGLAATIAGIGAADEIILAGTEYAADSGAVTVVPLAVPFAPGPAVATRARSVSVRARQAGTLVEGVRATDLERFARALDSLAAVDHDARRTWSAPREVRRTAIGQRDDVGPVAELLASLAAVHAVSGHEAPMRAAVRAALPEWARARAVVDTAGNLVVAVGPDRDTAVVIAHMDEIGFEITGIARDGTVSLRTRGSFYPSLWEGQPALLHDLAPGAAGDGDGALRGVFGTRDSATHRQPASLTAWFGRDSAALVAAGARIGGPVTAYKTATRLAGTRFTARSIDDRAGVTALLLAIRAVDPASLTHRTIFVWSVREEVGLEGAAAAGAEFGPSVHRVHAVDTFVSSDSPLESRRFGYAPLGAGAVVRALDNSSVTPPAEIARAIALARARGIPLRPGTTNGGNDGSELVRWGAVNVPIAWPLRYSHSPAELADLRDIRAMGAIVRALVEAP